MERERKSPESQLFDGDFYTYDYHINSYHHIMSHVSYHVLGLISCIMSHVIMCHMYSYVISYHTSGEGEKDSD